MKDKIFETTLWRAYLESSYLERRARAIIALIQELRPAYLQQRLRTSHVTVLASCMQWRSVIRDGHSERVRAEPQQLLHRLQVTVGTRHM